MEFLMDEINTFIGLVVVLGMLFIGMFMSDMADRFTNYLYKNKKED